MRLSRIHGKGAAAAVRRTCLLFASLIFLAAWTPGHAATDDSRGLDGRLLAGYQGWFGCPGDFAGNKAWQHWFVGAVSPRSLTVDLMPSVAGMRQDDLCNTGLSDHAGNPVMVYSSQNRGVVATHFRWMREHGIDGVAAQRFVSALPDDIKRARSDHLLQNVESAARANGRVFYLAYDVSGADAGSVLEAIRRDWRHIVDDLRLTQSAAYLRDGGKPVLELWGFGFPDRPGDPAGVAALIRDLKGGQDGLQAVTLVGGVPVAWRTRGAGSRQEPEWDQVYRAYDVISPWTVGRFHDNRSADHFAREVIESDMAETRRLGLRYMPVVFPGFSWHNLMTVRRNPTEFALNQIPRQCGAFMWRQVSNLLAAGAKTLYVAMFDEMDEGTALLPMTPTATQAPAGVPVVTLDAEGCVLPADWYLRIAGRASRALREGTFPPADLGAAMRDRTDLPVKGF